MRHFGEQPSSITRAAKEEIQGEEAVSELSGAGYEALEPSEAHVEKEPAGQRGEGRRAGAEQEEAR